MGLAVILLAAYVTGVLFVGAALRDDLELHPKETAAIILLWPIAIGLLWLAFGVACILKWLGLVRPIINAAEWVLGSRVKKP